MGEARGERGPAQDRGGAAARAGHLRPGGAPASGLARL